MSDLGVQGYGMQSKTGRTFAEIEKLYPDLAAEYGEGRISELRQKVNEKLEFQRLKDNPEAYEKKLVKAKEWRDKQGEAYRIAQNERMSRNRGQAWKYPAPRSAKDALWKDLARSAKQNKRLSFVGGYPEGQLTSKQFKDLDFMDNAKDSKGKPINKKITFDNLEKHISEHVQGKSYDDVIRPYDQKEFLRKEKLTQKLNEVLIKDFKPGSRQNVFHVQHVKNVATDPFDVHLTFGSQNVGERVSKHKFKREWKLAKNLTDKKKAVKNYYKSLGPDIQAALKNVPQGNKRTLVELLKKTGVDLPEEVITRATKLHSFPANLADIKLPKSVATGLKYAGKGLKGLGVLTAPLDVIPFAQQMERGAGIRSLDTGAARLLEDVINSPKFIAQMMGKDLPYEERTFGREYAQNVEQDIGLDKRLRSIEGMDVSPELKNQLVYDALGEVDMASLPEGYIEELKQAAKEPLVKKTIMDNQPLPDPDYLKV